MPNPEDNLRIDVESVDGATLFTLAGELDLAGESALSAALRKGEDASGGGVVAVDLSALEFMDSTGSRVLIEAHHRAEAAGRRFVVVASDGPALEVLERSGLVDYLAVTDDPARIREARPGAAVENGPA